MSPNIIVIIGNIRIFEKLLILKYQDGARFLQNGDSYDFRNDSMNEKKFRIVITSLPNRKNCVCEIYYDHIQWVEISQEDREVIIEFYPHPIQDSWAFSLDAALEALSQAKKNFYTADLNKIYKSYSMKKWWRVSH